MRILDLLIGHISIMMNRNFILGRSLMKIKVLISVLYQIKLEQYRNKLILILKVIIIAEKKNDN